MDELAKEYVIDFFTRRLLHFKDSPEAVGWSPSGQILRYQKVLQLINLENKTLLDFGCGKGDFYGFLKERGIICKYTGIDINPELIKLASSKYPDAEFLVKDIEQTPLSKMFDYTVSIGVFNLAVQGVKDSVKRCLEILTTYTREKLIFTCLDGRSKHKDIGVVYFMPEELEKIATPLAKQYKVLDRLVEGDLFLIIDVK